MNKNAIAENRAAAATATTPEDIARLVPGSWAFSFVSLEAALDFYYPNGIAAGRRK